jgi:hypothetical protein
MPYQVAWEAFKPDGSMLDLYVPSTSLDDWHRLISFVRRTYRTEYVVDLVPRKFPDDLESVFADHERASPLLKIFLNGVQINCQFYMPEDIELYFDPGEVTTEERALSVLRFLKEMGDVLDQTVLMTLESHPDKVVYRYEPRTEAPVYVPPPYF